MSAAFIDMFPLSVLQDEILLSDDDKNKMINFILKLEKDNPNKNKISKDDAWLGDTKGNEFLFKNSEMAKLEKLISDKIKIYTEMLGISSDKLDFYYQRSWATVTRKAERIKLHAHVQSNISFAYYLKKPENSGDLRFSAEPQNEIATGLFSGDHVNLGLIKKVNPRNIPNADIKIKENDIVVFPSKARHSTMPNLTDEPRISISGDVTIMLKDSLGYEKIMPHYNNWQLFS